MDEELEYEGPHGVDSPGKWSNHEQMVKKLVRMALACEYSRQPIRRADIAAKGAYTRTRMRLETSQMKLGGLMEN